jgi:hypothetical protein
MAKGIRDDGKPHDEAWVKDRVKEILKKYAVYYFMPSASRFGVAGIHDFITIPAGRFVSIETKAYDKPATPLQKRFGRKVQKSGGIALRIHSGNYKQLDTFYKLLFAGKLPPDYRGSNWDG